MHSHMSRLAGAVLAFALLSASCASGPRPRPEAPSYPHGFVVAHDGHLWLDGERYRFLGVNVYSLASRRGGYVCGMPHDDAAVVALLDEVAAMGGNAIRIDTFQSFTAGAEDFSRFDFILAQAYVRGIRVIMTLENEWGDCTEGGYKTSEWYRFGYRQQDGTFRLSYRDYVMRMVKRYRSHPGVLMWQLMNEAESADQNDCADPEPLLAFTADMTQFVKSIDRFHPVSLGTSGTEHPGSGSAFYAFLNQIPGVDVVEAHDYHAENEPLPPEIRIPILVARHLRKPFFVGESGMESPEIEPERRAAFMAAKMEAAWQADVDGYLVWSYRAWDGTGTDFGPSDPLVDALKRFSEAHHVRPAPH